MCSAQARAAAAAPHPVHPRCQAQGRGSSCSRITTRRGCSMPRQHSTTSKAAGTPSPSHAHHLNKQLPSPISGTNWKPARENCRRTSSTSMAVVSDGEKAAPPATIDACPALLDTDAPTARRPSLCVPQRRCARTRRQWKPPMKRQTATTTRERCSRRCRRAHALRAAGRFTVSVDARGGATAGRRAGAGEENDSARRRGVWLASANRTNNA